MLWCFTHKAAQFWCSKGLLTLIYNLAAAVAILWCGGKRQQTRIKPVHSLAPRTIHPSTNTHTHALKLKATRVHVQGRVLYNQTYCKLSSSSLRISHFQSIFQRVSSSDPLFSSNLVHPPLQSLHVFAPIHWPSTMHIALLFWLLLHLFCGIHNFIIDKGLSRYYQIS